MKALKLVDKHFEEFFLVILSAVMVVVIFLQVFMRFVMENSLSWSEELARYCFIWMIYFGISYGAKKQRHIKVDALLVLFKEKGKLVFGIVSNLMFLVFCGFVIKYGSGMAQTLLGFGQTSPALQIPMGLVYYSAPIGMGLAAIRLIQNIILQLRALLGKGEFKEDPEIEIEKMKAE